MIDPLEILYCGRLLAGFDEQLSDDGLSPTLVANETWVLNGLPQGGGDQSAGEWNTVTAL